MSPESAVLARVTANTGIDTPLGGKFITLGGKRLPLKYLETEAEAKNSFKY